MAILETLRRSVVAARPEGYLAISIGDALIVWKAIQKPEFFTISLNIVFLLSIIENWEVVKVITKLSRVLNRVLLPKKLICLKCNRPIGVILINQKCDYDLFAPVQPHRYFVCPFCHCSFFV